jgi:hypothetical protein
MAEEDISKLATRMEVGHLIRHYFQSAPPEGCVHLIIQPQALWNQRGKDIDENNITANSYPQDIQGISVSTIMVRIGSLNWPIFSLYQRINKLFIPPRTSIIPTEPSNLVVGEAGQQIYWPESFHRIFGIHSVLNKDIYGIWSL